MRRVALGLAALVAVSSLAPSAADAGKRRRAALRGRVHGKVVRHAPKRWRATGFRTGAAPVLSATVPAPGPSPAATATPAPVATPKPPALPAADASSVSVRSTEFAFTLSQPSVRAGRVRIQFDNSRAEDPHDLWVGRDGDQVALFGEAAPGAVSSRTVTLTAGTYTLLCPIADHAARGMTAELTVTS